MPTIPVPTAPDVISYHAIGGSMNYTITYDCGQELYECGEATGGRGTPWMAPPLPPCPPQHGTRYYFGSPSCNTSDPGRCDVWASPAPSMNPYCPFLDFYWSWKCRQKYDTGGTVNYLVSYWITGGPFPGQGWRIETFSFTCDPPVPMATPDAPDLPDPADEDVDTGALTSQAESQLPTCGCDINKTTDIVITRVNGCTPPEVSNDSGCGGGSSGGGGGGGGGGATPTISTITPRNAGSSCPDCCADIGDCGTCPGCSGSGNATGYSQPNACKLGEVTVTLAGADPDPQDSDDKGNCPA